MIACTLGVGCDESGSCYAAAMGYPEQCPREVNMSTHSIPTKIVINADQYKQLMKANDELQAINQMMTMFQQQCQVKMANMQQRANAAWQEIGKEHGLDLNSQMWAPSAEEPNTIVLCQAKFA